jgi:hypothetical protein
MQKSQIGGGVRVPPTGAFDVAYHRYGSKLTNQPEHETSFFDGIDTGIEGIADLAPSASPELRKSLSALQASIQETTQRFSPKEPSNLASSLATAMKQCDTVIEAVKSQSFDPAEKIIVLRELEIKYVQINDAVALALGLTLTAVAPANNALTGTTVDASVTLTQNSELPVMYQTVRSGNSTGDGIQEGTGLPSSEPHLAPGHPVRTECGLSPNLTAAATRPYFFRSSIEKPAYELIDPNLRNAPATPPALRCFVQLAYDGVGLLIGAIASHDGQPINFVPALSVSLSNHAQVLPSSNRSFLLAEDAVPLTQGEDFNLTVPSGWHVSPHPANPPNENTINTSLITVDKQPKKPVTIPTFVKLPDGKKYSEGYRPIGYGDLPRTNYYTPAAVRIVPVDLNLPATHRIAYLPGTGDAVPEALASINLKPDILTVADLNPAKLAQYDTVILGVRTYAAHPDLHGAPTQALLDYARNGGNVLVQYQTAEFTAADAPYPLTLGYAAEKVVDETDPVQLLDAKAPFLSTPNKITPADFNDWVEERGHGFLGSWDSHYTALTETHDPDQDPQRGGLITTKIGKGKWTYCAFALYRQLPEAVPGAFRLFVNLLSAAPSK